MALLKLLDKPVEQANLQAFRGLSKTEIEQLTALLQKTRQAHNL